MPGLGQPGRSAGGCWWVVAPHPATSAAQRPPSQCPDWVTVPQDSLGPAAADGQQGAPLSGASTQSPKEREVMQDLPVGSDGAEPTPPAQG